MGTDYTVRVVGINTVPTTDTFNRFVQVKRISIKVGPHGPFIKDFPPGQDSVDTINAWKTQTQMEVMAVDPQS